MSRDRLSSPSSSPRLPEINLAQPSKDTFDMHAQEYAHALSDGRKNASSQLRRFYDEVLMWQQKVRGDKENMARFLPLIMMLHAKAAYALGRGHVTEEFLGMIRNCLGQLDAEQPQTLDNFKLFFEAVMGFKKYLEETTKGRR